MTRIVEWAVNNTRVVIALMVVVIVAGVMAFNKIPKEAQPDIPIPVLTVQVTYPGISPEDSERLLVKPLETTLRSVEVKTMTARAFGAWLYHWSSTSLQQTEGAGDVHAQSAWPRCAPQEANPRAEVNIALAVISVALWGGDTRCMRATSDRLADPGVLTDIGGRRMNPQRTNPLEAYGITAGTVRRSVALLAGHRRPDQTGRPFAEGAGVIENGRPADPRSLSPPRP